VERCINLVCVLPPFLRKKVACRAKPCGGSSAPLTIPVKGHLLTACDLSGSEADENINGLQML